MTDATLSSVTSIVDAHLNPESPPVDSPATPINNTSTPDVRIDLDFHEESDARHEPLPIKVENIDKASAYTELPSSEDSVVSIQQSNGTSPSPPDEDTRMTSEEAPPTLSPHVALNEDSDAAMLEQDATTPPTSNGPTEDDVKMDQTTEEPPASPPVTATTVAESVDQSCPPRIDDNDHDLEDQPPPTKRARKHSNADQESTVNTATPPPATSPAPQTNGVVSHVQTQSIPSSSSKPSFTQAQFKFCLSALRQVKKSKDAKPFLYPVDSVAMNIPHYPSIITHPMDFSTIERKLNASNPAKPDSNSDIPLYHSAEEFIVDVRLIFSNCVTFNGPEHQIAMMGRRVEELFDKSLKNLPGPEEPKPPVVKKEKAPVQPAPPPPAPPVQPVPKRANIRRPSTSVPTIRRNDSDGPAAGRPKREIHPPPPKDLPYADAPKKPRKARASKDNLAAEQLRFCSKILADLHRKTHWAVASPFYEPVDWVALDLPSYPKVVKKPMDLSTMRKRLDNHEYPNATKFFEDFKLMIRNCFLFNPPGTPVNQAGIDLQRLFDEKWKSLPQAKSVDDPEIEQEEEETDEDRERILEMENQIEMMKGSISALKKKSEKKTKKTKPYSPPTASTSKASTKAAAKQAPKKKGGRKSTTSAPVDDDVLTFEQKKDLSEAIGSLDGTKLEKVIGIIHEGVPEIRDSTEEIELEIDLLPAHVLTKLYNFVIRPSLRTTAPKRSRTGKGTGTGGLKRKSMDEDVEAEKIRQLEARMALFENPDGAPAGATERVANGHDSDRSSDSSDQSDSSGSDSE